MPGMTDERHIVEGGLALCAALRTLVPAEGETADWIADAEQHFKNVRTRASKAEKPEKPMKPEKESV